MSCNPAVPVVSTRAPAAPRPTYIRAGLGLALVTALAAFATPAAAQRAAPSRPFELRPVAGTFVPTGDQSDLLEGAALVGAQASYSFTPNVALVGSFGWSPSKDKLVFAREKVDLYQYDLGLEGRMNDLTPSAIIKTRPYAALGVGGRTYDYRDLDGVDKETNLLGYGAVGLDFGRADGAVGLRLEVRDNITAFKGLQGERADRKARNDIQFSAGLTFRP